MSATIDLQALAALAPELDRRFDELKRRKLALDMTRGKPAPEQLDLANGLLTILGATDYVASDGTDCRNYGGLDGLPEAVRRLHGGRAERSAHRRQLEPAAHA